MGCHFAERSGELLGAGEFRCGGPWPDAPSIGGKAAATVECGAEVEVRGWEAPVLRLETHWPAEGQELSAGLAGATAWDSDDSWSEEEAEEAEEAAIGKAEATMTGRRVVATWL